MPIDFDGNWPGMDLRPTAVLLHGVSVAPRSLVFGLPQFIAFPLLLFDCSNSNSKAALFFILVWESLSGIIPVLLPRDLLD